MRTPLVIISNDKHLKESTIDVFESVCQQEIELAQKLNVRDIFWLGDIFDSRVNQRQSVLTTLGEVLNRYNDAKLQITCIPGNHDKTDYRSEDSFLDPFAFHPGFHLIRNPERVNVGDWSFLFIPYFDEDMWEGYYKQSLDDSKILCSHISLTGSRNNDGTIIENNIKPTLFSSFDKVFLGHYHNMQKIGGNIYHLPSTYQRDFGEDTEKGFTIFYSDGDHDLYRAKFPTYTKSRISIDEVSAEELTSIIRREREDEKTRIELYGDKNKIQSFLKGKRFEGVDIKIIYDEDIDSSKGNSNFTEFNDSIIRERFIDFCNREGLDKEEGLKLLNKIL